MAGTSKTIPLDFVRGMWRAGDAARLPEGYCRKLRNAIIAPGGVAIQRPQFTYDNVASVEGLAQWEDDANKVTRLISIDTTGNLRAKATSSETWGSPATGTVSGSRLTGFDTFRGKGYGVLDNGAGLPSGAFSYDGVTVSTTPFNSEIFARSIVFYKERAFLVYPRVTVTPQKTSSSLKRHYDWTVLGWAPTNVTASNLVTTVGSNTTTVCRLFPTSTAAECKIECHNDSDALLGDNFGLFLVPAGEADVIRVWRQDMKPVDATYRLPLTMELELVSPVQVFADPVPIGFVISRDSGGANYIFRCTTSGTVSGAEPAWTAVIGAASTWGTADFTNIGPSILASQPFLLSNATENPGQWYTFTASARCPWSQNGYGVMPRIKFSNRSNPLLTTLAPLDVSLKDGKPDGDISKRNYGLQVTSGEFGYPFVNTETAQASTQDLDEIICSEIGDPARVLGSISYNMGGTSGFPTAGAIHDGRIIVFKRRSYWRFAVVEDADVVFLPEGDETVGIGCLGPLAQDTHEGALYFIGENDIYEWQRGDAPLGLCGDGMRDEIMNRAASSWVESQTYNMPLLAIDKRNHVLYAYTQKGTLFAYHLKYKAWSVLDVGGGTAAVSPVGYEIRALMYHAETGGMYAAFATAATGTAGLARLDVTQSGAEDQISTSGTLPVVAEIWPPAIEATAPHMDMIVHTIRFRHAVTASQASQTTTAYASFDGGVTFPRSIAFTLGPVSTGAYKPLEFPVYQGWHTIQPRIVHSGNGGASNFAVSAIEADILVTRGYYPKDKPTFGASTL